MKSCTKCGMTLDTGTIYPACGEELTCLPYGESEKEHYVFNTSSPLYLKR